MHSERTILSLVGSIYDPINDQTLWPVFLEKLAGSLRSTATNLFVQDLRHPGGAASATFGTDPSFTRSYADYYGKINIFLIRGRPFLKTGNVCFSDELCPSEEAFRSEFFNDWVLPQGQQHGLLGIIFNRDSLAGNIGAIRARSANPFTVEDKRLIHALMPHLQRAVGLCRRIGHLEALQKNNANALDRWATAVFVVDREGHILLKNETAAALLRRRDGLTTDRNILHAARSDDAARLHRMIRDATEAPYHRSSGNVMLIARPSDKGPFTVLVSPSVREDMFFGVRSTALVFVSDPEAEQTQADILRSLYGLSPAEAHVASQVVDGRGLKEVSEELHVSLNTAKTHLKRIFEKTGTQRQAELVSLVLHSPAVLKRAA